MAEDEAVSFGPLDENSRATEQSGFEDRAEFSVAFASKVWI